MSIKQSQNSSKIAQNPVKNRKIQAKSIKKHRIPHESECPVSVSNKKHYKANRERLNAKALERYKLLSPAERAMNRWRAAAKPYTPKPGSFKSKDPRVMARARAYCDFSDAEEVVRIYMACAIMNELEMGQYEVDHSVPLGSPLVSGLQTHTNLQVISTEENRTKGNLFWPQMWPQDWSTMDLLMQ